MKSSNFTIFATCPPHRSSSLCSNRCLNYNIEKRKSLNTVSLTLDKSEAASQVMKYCSGECAKITTRITSKEGVTQELFSDEDYIISIEIITWQTTQVGECQNVIKILPLLNLHVMTALATCLKCTHSHAYLAFTLVTPKLERDRIMGTCLLNALRLPSKRGERAGGV